MDNEFTIDALEEVYEDLGWTDILLLSLIGVAGGVLGQFIFDLCNSYTNGALNSFLISLIIKPLNLFAKTPTNYNFWPSIDISIFLFRWILGAGAIGLSLGLAMKFEFKKVLYMFAIGCLIGLVSWLASSYAIELIPGIWQALVAAPGITQIVLTCSMIGLLFSLTVHEFRTLSLFFRFMFAGFLGGLVGKYISVFSTAALLRFLISIQSIFETGINPVRLADAMFVTFLVNLFSLIFLKEYLRMKIKAVQKAGK